MERVHIGVDLDNTLIDYGEAFGVVAQQMELLGARETRGGKAAVKVRLLEQDPSERLWMRLQGQVYGSHLDKARLCAGAGEFLMFARDRGARVSIVSHKTRHGHFDPAQVDLWKAAREWLRGSGFFDPDRFALAETDVHFETTREAKIARIAAIGCHIFIDDLEDVLRHPAFPRHVERILCAADRAAAPGLVRCGSWREIMDKLAERL
jgi:hypothetical protein